jgi:hypothetical protein
MSEINPWLAWGGLGIGLVFGFLAQRLHVCLVHGFSNWLLIRDWRQLHSFLAALAVMIVGTQFLETRADVAIGESAYRAATLDWAGAIAGGLLFGFGAALAGGCALRVVVGAAEGKLGALLALLAFAALACVTQFGALEGARIALHDATAITLAAGDGSMAALMGLPQWALAAGVVIASLGMIAGLGRSTRDWRFVAGGVVFGALVVLAWWISGALAQDEFNPSAPSAVSISGPLARVAYYLAAQQAAAVSLALGFIAGLVVGGASSAIIAGHWRIEAPVAGYVGQHLFGGALMGVGAITAGGCNIGHGMSGVSTLALGSWLCLAAMLAGIALGVWWLGRDKYVKSAS